MVHVRLLLPVGGGRDWCSHRLGRDGLEGGALDGGQQVLDEVLGVTLQGGLLGRVGLDEADDDQLGVVGAELGVAAALHLVGDLLGEHDELRLQQVELEGQSDLLAAGPQFLAGEFDLAEPIDLDAVSVVHGTIPSLAVWNRIGKV